MSLAERAQSHDSEELLAVAADPGLTEELALALLGRRELPGGVIEAIGKNPTLLKSRKVAVAIASHSLTPRHVSLPLIRQLYTFELVKVALLPVVPADVKVAIEEAIVSRQKQMTDGERLTLARQGPGRVAGALLLDREARVRSAALENPKMTEAILLKALAKPETPPGLVLEIGTHPKWSLRRDLQLALLRNPHTPLAQAIACAGQFCDAELAEILSQSELRAEIKQYLLKSRQAKA